MLKENYMTNEIENLRKTIEESNNIVFFGGAGVSTESNIPDFRSENGIFNAVNKYGFPPEKILSKSFFNKNKEIFFDYCKENLIHLEAVPNYAHKALAKLESQGKLKAVITQNIDNLHQKAGSSNVLELHGTLYKNFCINCGKTFDIDYIMSYDSIPKCNKCGDVVRPDIVLYEEFLNEEIMTCSIKYIQDADVLIIGGTSLNVYPAAGLINYFKGSKLVLINKSETGYDSKADIIIHENIGKVFEKIMTL